MSSAERVWRIRSLWARVALSVLVVAGAIVAIRATTARVQEPQAVEIATGKFITPTAAAGAIFQELNPQLEAASELRAGFAAAVSVSPDGHILAILTSGFNLHWDRHDKPLPEASTEYVFLFDISRPQPKQLQVLPIPNTYVGLAWAPASERLFASAGKNDAVVEIVRNGTTFSMGRTFPLGHNAGNGRDAGPVAGSIAVSPDGTYLLVANLENDSVSLVALATGQVVAEQDLRPGIVDPQRHGQPGGSFPSCVAWGSPGRVYVGSARDREILSLAISGTKLRIERRIAVHGQPLALLRNRIGSRLYAALDNTDQVAIFDTTKDNLIEMVGTVAPESLYANANKLGGANSNALALTPNGRTLLVSNGGENAVAVIRLSDRAAGLATESGRGQDAADSDDKAGLDHSAVIGLVPTGWYPTGVATSENGATWYVINAKSETGPSSNSCEENLKQCLATNEISNPANRRNMLRAHNQYIHQLERAGFLTLPAPVPAELARLTKQVARNNHFDQPQASASDQRLFSFLRAHIKHVIYIIKENRTYDQVLGDLEIGNGDPHLTLFPDRTSPNHHSIARNFVTLDNFLVSGEVSWTGWDWSVSAQTNDFRERAEPLAMASYWNGGRGVIGETGLNRNINVGYATSKERQADDPLAPADPDVLPGTGDVYAPDGPGGEEGKGYLWDTALRQGRTVRNWGFWGENRAFPPPDTPFIRDPYAEKHRVFFPTKSSLMAYSDPYFLDFGPAFPDFWRIQEWKREFAGFSAANSAPSLMLIRLGNDHFGSFDKAIDGVNTPETQMADNDYALGLIVEAVANSRFANDTLIISIEDDACDGPDHVDAHRSVVLFVGPYVRQHVLVSKKYTTVSVVRTIEEILGLDPIGLNDAFAAPMAELFDPAVTSWSYKPIVPDVLRSTALPLPATQSACYATPKRSSEYWTTAMAKQDFSGADRVNPATFNRALWRGLKGDEPYPATATNNNLRMNRAQLLASMQSVTLNACVPSH